MLKNKSVGRLTGGCYTKYIRYISSVYINNDAFNLNRSIPLLQDSHLNCLRGQRRNLCVQRKPVATTSVNFGKRTIEDGCSDFTNAHSAKNAPLATVSYSICENPKSIYYKSEKETKGRSDSDLETLLVRDSTDEGKELKKQKNKREEFRSFDEGDIVDLHELLFTKNRDYLIKYNGNQVKAEQLAGKVIVIYFVLLPLDDESDLAERLDTEILKDVYNYLPPDKGFEIVFVAVDDVDTRSEEEMLFDPSPETDLENHFEDVFSCMPWTAIPFSDITSRKRLQRRFGFIDCYASENVFVIDRTGVVLHSSHMCFEDYGALGYPFSKEWLDFLDSECEAIATQPTLEKLLSSPERDYVISNNGDKVPIHTLEDKVVALYFYADNTTQTDRLTEELKKAYEELAKKEENFEVVLLYLSDTDNTFGRRNEESFWNTFKTMPWLALPYKDPNLKKLKIIYEYPEDCESDDEEVSMLVIIGPRGEFCEPCGADILLNFKVPGYPFTREKALKLETERIKELKLEMIWEPNTVFSRNNGSQVSLSQLAGKRILLLFGLFGDEFLNVLKERYLYLKGTDGEFEVIHIYTSETEATEAVLDPAWFVYPLQKDFLRASDILPFEFDKRYFKRGDFYDVGDMTRFLAFDRNGMIVRDTAFPTIEDMNFPFYTSGLEKETLLQLDSVFSWYQRGDDKSSSWRDDDSSSWEDDDSSSWEDDGNSSCQAGYVGPNQCIPIPDMLGTICILWEDDTESYSARLIFDC